ncbi:MAG TPA: zinc ribbon domain-containing protein, partial [Sedimentisphaerales bacterium]
FMLDANMYSLVEKERGDKKSQFVTIMGLTPRKRVTIPLTGYSNFSGNIRVVLDFKKQRVEIHTTAAVLNPEIEENGNVIPLDAGCTEVFTDELGTAYEPTFGKTLLCVSDQLNRTGKGRNKAHALKKTSSKHKAHRIRKYNLGKQKLRKRKLKAQIRIKQQISQAIRQVVDQRQPSVVVTERLDIRGKAQSRRMSRLVSYWMRGSLKERLEFLALVEGFHHKQVNPAYTSQTCPTCLFVHGDNRKGDIFKCLNCGHTDYADRVAAINLLARSKDPDITIYTPKSVVRSILQKRFSASLEKSSLARQETRLTVSGRTDVQSKGRQSETPPLNFTMGAV